MPQNSCDLFCELFDCLDYLCQLQYLVKISLEHFSDSELDERSQRVQVLLDRYLAASDFCFDEFDFLRSKLSRLGYIKSDSHPFGLSDVSDSLASFSPLP